MTGSLSDEAAKLGLEVHEDADCLILGGVARLVGGHEQDLWWLGRDAATIEEAREMALVQVRRIAGFIPCWGCEQRFDPSDLSAVFHHEHAGLVLPVLAEPGRKVE
jgi:hypothetical protein